MNDFLMCNTQIENHCNTISETLLWQIENMKIYDLEPFESLQSQHQNIVRQKLTSIYDAIVTLLNGIFDIFRNDGPAVYSHWVKYIESIDAKIEHALRIAVKKSLTEISKAINGEGKNRESGIEVHPLFKVNVVLDTQKVDFSPTFSKLQETVNKVSRDMISVISIVTRLTEVLTPESSQATSRFYDIIAAEDDVLKIFVNIQTGMAHNATKCQAYVRNWDSYREIWEINKDAFIRRYAKLKPALSTFDADINRYIEVANNAQKEETLININFTRLDCSLLKHAIVSHCNAWQSKLTTLLNQNAYTELSSLIEMFNSTTEKLRAPPKDLDQLSEALTILQPLQADTAKIEAQFAPIQEMYQILETYEVQIKEEEKAKLQSLPSAWSHFQETLQFAEVQLQEAKSKFKADLVSSSDDFAKMLVGFREDFTARGHLRLLLE